MLGEPSTVSNCRVVQRHDSLHLKSVLTVQCMKSPSDSIKLTDENLWFVAFCRMWCPDDMTWLWRERGSDLYQAITYLYTHCHTLWRAIFMCRTFIALKPGQCSPNDNPSIKIEIFGFTIHLRFNPAKAILNLVLAPAWFYLELYSPLSSWKDW